eukprot:197929-Karenia_brevis.AAC.1
MGGHIKAFMHVCGVTAILHGANRIINIMLLIPKNCLTKAESNLVTRRIPVNLPKVLARCRIRHSKGQFYDGTIMVCGEMVEF